MTSDDHGGTPGDDVAPTGYQFAPDGSSILVTLVSGASVLADVATGEAVATTVDGFWEPNWQRLAAGPVASPASRCVPTR